MSPDGVDEPTPEPIPTTPNAPSLSAATWVWLRVAALSFGGPAGQIAVMHRIVVDEKRWLDEQRFLHALNYCMLLPGPEAQQLATYIGWLKHRTLGGLIAGGLFVLPGFVAMLLASLIYVRFPDVIVVEGIMSGLKPAVLAVVLHSAVRLSQRILNRRAAFGISIVAFVAMFFLNIPFPWVLGIGALCGLWLLNTPLPFPTSTSSVDPHPSVTHELPPSLKRTLFTLSMGLLIWWIPIGCLAWRFGVDSVWVQEGLFFSQTALITFGGAYSVLTYVGQQAVERFGWLKPTEMLDGLSLGETTPGPLVMVVQFVAFVGAFRNPGELDPWLSGILGSIVAVWVTFVPCFMWVFLGAPYVEQLRRHQRLNAAMAGITAAVLGVIANLFAWFALHTWFTVVERETITGLGLLLPDLSTINPAAIVISLVALLMTFVWKRGLAVTLLSGAGLGLVWHVLQHQKIV